MPYDSKIMLNLIYFLFHHVVSFTLYYNFNLFYLILSSVYIFLFLFVFSYYLCIDYKCTVIS